MQMIPTAVQGPDVSVGQTPQPAAAGADGSDASLVFPELLKQAVTPQSPQAASPDVSTMKPGPEAMEFAAEGPGAMAAFDALWGELSQMAIDAQNAFQSATSTGAKVEVMENFVTEFQARVASFQSTAHSAFATLTGQFSTALAQPNILQIGIGDGATANPMEVFEKAIGMLQSMLPAMAQTNVDAVPALPASHANGAPTQTEVTPLAQALQGVAADVQKPASPVAATVAQASATGPVQPASLTARAVPLAPVEPATQTVAPLDPRAAGQGEDPLRALAPETPKAALTNVALGAEGAKASGQAPAALQTLTPSAPLTAAPDAGQTLTADLPAAATARASADLAPAFSFARNIAAQVRGTVFEEGKTRVELTPRGLGDIEVEVARDDSGKLRVVLRAENAAVLTAFRNDREMILGMLRESGVAVDEGEVAFESFGGHGSYQDRGQPQDIEPIARASIMTEDDLTGTNIERRPDIRPTDGLDITT